MASEASRATTLDSSSGKPRRKLQSNVKSRNGCLHCKKRKVKCDEAPGSCGACLRRGDRCSLTPSTLPSSPARPDVVPVSSLVDLRLLHNWSSRTVLCMTDNEFLRQFYRGTFLDEVLKHDFLLHCVLAFSAFHLVEQREKQLNSISDFHRPEIESDLQRYLAAAQTHLDASIRSFRHTLSDITQENRHALLACSTFLFVTSVAESAQNLRLNHPQIPTQKLSSPYVSSFLKWPPLLRGSMAIAQTADLYTQIESGHLAPMFTLKNFVGLTCRERWQKTFSYLDKLATAFQEHSEDSVRLTCLAAIEVLREQMRERDDEPESAAAFRWTLEVDHVFLELLEAQVPEALLVFSLYCVLLHSQNWRWWIKDWPAKTVRTIEPMLSERWRGLLDWPLAVTEDGSGESAQETRCDNSPPLQKTGLANRLRKIDVTTRDRCYTRPHLLQTTKFSLENNERDVDQLDVV